MQRRRGFGEETLERPTPVDSRPVDRFQIRRRRLPRRRRAVVRRAERQDRRPRRRIRLRQVGDRAGDPAHPAEGRPHRRRIDPVRRSGERRAAGRHRGARSRRRDHPGLARRPDRDDLPGADDLALAAAHGRRPGQRGAACCTATSSKAEALDRCRRRLRPGRLPRSEAGARHLSVRALRRASPARHDRHGLDHAPGPPHRRRADDGARRHHAGADPRPDARAAGRGADVAVAHHPRPRRRRQHGRPRRRDVSRPGRRGRAARGPLQARAAPLSQGPDAGGAALRHGAGRAPDADPRGQERHPGAAHRGGAGPARAERAGSRRRGICARASRCVPDGSAAAPARSTP